MGKNRVCYFYDSDIAELYYAAKHPMKPHRVTMTHHLVLGYDLHQSMDVYEFIDLLRRVENGEVEPTEEETAEFGVGGEDCPAFEGLYNFCRIYGGASVDGARKLATGQYEIAINWAGGLHHAKRAEASGFCYINDLVLGILELLKTHARVLYIDIDVHHGDGVEEAFYLTDRCMTVSFHKYGDYFFPGTGALHDKGEGRGRGYSVNVPLKDGATDAVFLGLYKPIIQKIMDVYRPGAIVLQCGADSLAADRLGCFMLTIAGHCKAVEFTAAFGVPMLVTGGGGYTKANVARCWANETAALVKVPVSERLPSTAYDEYFADDPTLRLRDLGKRRIENFNKPDAVHELLATVLQNLADLEGAPGLSFSERPPESLLPGEEDTPAAYDRLTEYCKERNYIRDRNDDPLW